MNYSKHPPRICSNCFFLYQPISGGNSCRKGLILPRKKQTSCKRYEGWVSFNESSLNEKIRKERTG